MMLWTKSAQKVRLPKAFSSVYVARDVPVSK